MAAGLGAYRVVLADPAARAFSSAALLARLPISMTGIGVVLLVSLESGSFGRAGLVTATATLTAAGSAPLWGRAVDRVGQAPVLVAAALVWTLAQGCLVATVLLGWPLAAVLAAAVGVGLGFSSAGSSVRARWNHRLQGSPLLDTAFALEAVLDEVVFIVGPVLVTFLATRVHPAVALGVSATVGLVGALALAAQRGTEPPRAARRTTTGARARIEPRTLVPVVVASVALGGVFGAMEVVVVAFATETGVLPWAGTILMAWAVGSLVSGIIAGTLTWRRSPAARFRIGAACLGLSLLPLPWLRTPTLLAAVLLVGGMAIAPTLIASVSVVQASVPESRLTEALAWSTTGLAGGLAGGAALAGLLVDRGGSATGFAGVVGIGVLLIVSALGVRSRPAQLVDVSSGPPGTRPAAR